MQMTDAECVSCGRQRLDFLVRGDGIMAPCETCGGQLARFLKPGVAGAVRPDEIPGGVWMKHGICNADGTAKRYDRWSDVRKAAKEAGYENHVTHITEPGTDKAKHTTRWVGVPQCLTPEDEAARVAHWHENEALLQTELAKVATADAALSPADREVRDRQRETGLHMLDYLR